MSAEPEGSAAPDPETLTIDCPNCGDDVIEGYIHDCPVSGSEIVIRQIDGEFQVVGREEPKDVDVELAPDQETVDIRDERSQKNFDQLVLTGAVRQLREILAQQKVQYHLSKNGIGDNAGKGHPEQLKREIKRTREQLALLVEFSNDGGEIPEPSDLEIASALPAQGEAQKMGLQSR